MGEVFLARQDLAGGVERTLVVKRILPHLSDDEKFVRLFLREAHTASRLQHRNIVRIYQVGQERSLYYIAMEHVDGKDLRSYLTRSAERRFRVPAGLACYIVSEICAGLAYAHTKTGPTGECLHLVHRDVSPQNVLLSYEGDVRLIDFGISRAADGLPMTHPGGFEGKVPYLSPEQARGESPDPRSDIFSAGLLFFELLCQRRFFQEGSEYQILETLRGFSVDRALAPWRPRLPRPVCEILEKALHHDPAGRYALVQEMRSDIDRFRAEKRFPSGAVELAQSMNELFSAEMAREGEGLDSTRTQAPASATRPAADAAAPPSCERAPDAAGAPEDRRILKHKLVILVLLLIVLLEAAVFIVREHHWKREGLYKYRSIRRIMPSEGVRGP